MNNSQYSHTIILHFDSVENLLIHCIITQPKHFLRLSSKFVDYWQITNIIITMTRSIIHLSKMACRYTSSYSSFVKHSKKIVGAGLNYKYEDSELCSFEYLKFWFFSSAILKTSNVPKPEKPIVFLKPSSSYIQEGESIVVSI